MVAPIKNHYFKTCSDAPPLLELGESCLFLPWRIKIVFLERPTHVYKLSISFIPLPYWFMHERKPYKRAFMHGLVWWFIILGCQW